MPHLLLFGPSGCGKTSLILALGRSLFKEHYHDRVIELNASDERGIKIVRNKIKLYAKNAISKKDDIPPWKLIILDEADTMTPDSQFALRKIMEDYSHVTRFCIICNYHNKIIDPIVSRCSFYRFKPVTKNNLHNRLKDICNKELLNYDDTILDNIIYISRGDMRKAINILQKCKNISVDKIKIENLYDTLGIINLKILNKSIEYALKKEFKKINYIINLFINNSYSIINQLKFISELIIQHKKIDDVKKSKILLKIVDIDQSLLIGCCDVIQYYKLFYYIMSI